MAERFAPGHFRLGRLNEAAGVCGGRGTYGYSIDLETSGTDDLQSVRVESALPCIENGGIKGPGSLDGVGLASNRTCLAPNGTGSHQHGHTYNAHAGARCRFGTECQLRTVNDRLPLNRSPADLLSGEFLDDHHGAATARAKPSWGGLGLAASSRLRGLLWSGLQQLLTKGQKLSPAPVSQEAGKANPYEPAR